MNLELSTLFFIGLAYLSLLFAVAYVTDRGLVPASLVTHPLVYTLSLGVFAGAWSFFGMTAVAADFGYGYLGYAIGAGALFLFAPLLLMPLLRICRRYQLTSLADVLSFRYRGPYVGAIVTIGTLAATIPLLAAQIKIVSDIASILTGHHASHFHQIRLGMVFTVAIAVFAILFGARSISESERHDGLVVTMAFESLVKLAAFLLVGWCATVEVFGGVGGIGAWLAGRPDLLDGLASTVRSSSTHMLALLFLSAAIGLPHLFHMGLYENPSMRAVFRASWGFPLFLLALSLPILPVLWAGTRLGLDLPTAYFGAGLGMATGSPAISLIAFVGGLSAASSTIIVITLALASMTLNNLLLPFYRLRRGNDLYRGLLVTRSVLIAVIILGAQVFALAMPEGGSVEKLGFAAFIAAAQFFPGTLALLYWPRANHLGLICGLGGGFVAWLLLVVLADTRFALSTLESMLPLRIDGNPWATAAINSIGLNVLLFIGVSVLTKAGGEEREAAAACSLDNLSGRGRHPLRQRSPAEFIAGLSGPLGEGNAAIEVQRALRDLGYVETESRPYAMRRLRDRIEANLSRLMGASVAMEIVDSALPYADQHQGTSGDDIFFVESRLERYRGYLTGFTAELDALRRFYRRTLQELPVGVCGINTDGEIVMWNQALEELTQIHASTVLGSTLAELPDPWAVVIRDFANSENPHAHNQRLQVRNETLWVSLHKTLIESPDAPSPDARFILIEDVTETQLLQEELIHSERLASIGRLAAGVAHEIGNPVTGIDCLAQNLLAETEEPASRDGARQILNQTHRITNIVQTLVNFAHSGINRRDVTEPLCVCRCADEAIYFLQLDRTAPQVRFVNLCDRNVMVEGDGQRLLQVLVNLLSNARDASQPGGEIRLETRAAGDLATISVTDNGSGIPSEAIDQVLEPFFTTKAPGAGTGLGLSLVYAIVRDMRGSIAIESPLDPASGGGTRVTVTLPRAATDAAADVPDAAEH